jgi:hypothetical protein
MSLKNVLASLFASRRPYVRQPGEGVARAEARLDAKRKTNAAIPDLPSEPSRQVRRAFARKLAKHGTPE